MSYVDGFVLPVPKKQLAAYRKQARKAGKVWMDHGALSYVEAVADDVKPGKRTSFPQSVKLKSGEVVVFSYVLYKSRADRNRILKKVMADPRLADQTAEAAARVALALEAPRRDVGRARIGRAERRPCAVDALELSLNPALHRLAIGLVTCLARPRVRRARHGLASVANRHDRRSACTATSRGGTPRTTRSLIRACCAVGFVWRARLRASDEQPRE
jgi:uncharacterized protein YbaA (DUF1428 family)